jgi:hypothetical protein
MYRSMHSWSWLWMVFAGVVWIVVLGAIVYIAVRLAQQHGRGA